MKKLAIIIPARYGSSRFEGKPLAHIAGKSMLQRVHEIAKSAIEKIGQGEVFVATEDDRIKLHAESIGAKSVMTPDSCKTGSDRVLSACENIGYEPDMVINLQGDAPLTPVSFVEAIAKQLLDDDSADVVTPVVQLSWEALDVLRESKKTTPFSGTTAIVDKDDNALWFSKNIIPAIRNEQHLRLQGEISPVLKHVGMYGYKYDALKKFVSLPEGIYEKLEGLEQLRIIESAMKIKAVRVEYGSISPIGVDTPEDAKRVEEILKQLG
ncbi:MAG: 3-deoxy-manno-octulosonate cytidylyltransferase [Alphaproteobacteria bacterium CG11_big_fil_rev_8_21_14_0_20_39_49]|nr:MAG: 3-deoxy-manno-octulosonate cytidylyltransferase [Alphaproteobacteria bacterium CG11_big_fil_rev_8_21_14_0_20_39_49]